MVRPGLFSNSAQRNNHKITLRRVRKWAMEIKTTLKEEFAFANRVANDNEWPTMWYFVELIFVDSRN